MKRMTLKDLEKKIKENQFLVETEYVACNVIRIKDLLKYIKQFKQSWIEQIEEDEKDKIKYNEQKTVVNPLSISKIQRTKQILGIKEEGCEK